MTNFHFLSRVQPALIQRQCKREERKESEYDELSFSFPSAACSYLKNQQLVIVLPEGSEELPIRIVRGSRSRREAHAHPSTRLRANGLQAHQLRCLTAATSRPHVGGCLCTRLTTNGAIPCPVLRRHHGRVQVTEAILSHVHLTTPGTAQSGSGGNPSRLQAHEETDFGRVVGSSKYVTYESQADEKGCRWNVVLLLHIASSVVTPPDVPDGSRQSAERRAKRRRTVRRAVAGCPRQRQPTRRKRKQRQDERKPLPSERSLRPWARKAEPLRTPRRSKLEHDMAATPRRSRQTLHPQWTKAGFLL